MVDYVKALAKTTLVLGEVIFGVIFGGIIGLCIARLAWPLAFLVSVLRDEPVSLALFLKMFVVVSGFSVLMVVGILFYRFFARLKNKRVPPKLSPDGLGGVKNF